jgi:tRNA(Ile)-lysidine synthase
VLYDFKEELILRPGETAAYFNWLFSCEIVPSIAGISYTEDNWQQFLDADKCGEVLLIRGRKPGEKFLPLGAPGRKKLQDYMVDVKIPRELRDLWPMVVRMSEEAKIIWVAGYAIAEEFKITPETKRVLRLSVEPV